MSVTLVTSSLGAIYIQSDDTPSGEISRLHSLIRLRDLDWSGAPERADGASERRANEWNRVLATTIRKRLSEAPHHCRSSVPLC